jgi:molecular chaperone DnaK (HSP70)
MRAGRAVGVDFGTSTSLVAERVGRNPVQVATLGRTTHWFPSLAGYSGETLLIGEDAENLPTDRVIRSIKRAITEDLEVVQVMGDRGLCEVPADDIIVAVLAEIVRRAEREEVRFGADGELRLGCPAMWNGPQRQRLLDLATKAGLPVDDSTLVDEPIAAGVAWVMHRFLTYGERPEGRLLVFDMGGGTLDIAVLDVEGGERPEISVLSALGSARAGDVLDRSIARDLKNELAQRGIEIARLPRPKLAEALLLREARDAKVSLSRADTHHTRGIRIRDFGVLPSLPYTREQLEEAFRPQMDEAEALVWAALRAALLTEVGDRSPDQLRRLGRAELADSINYVLLAGGMSRIPYVGRRIGQLFPHAQVFDDAGVPAEEAIVAGLADTWGYERINLHRPGFDFILEWSEGGRREELIVYPAYTPFYEPWQVLSGHSDLGYVWHGGNLATPPDGTGLLRVRSTSGEYLGLKIDNQSVSGLSLNLGSKMMFKLYCNGRVLIHDGKGRVYALRVDRWPVIRGRDFAELVLRSARGQGPSAPMQWYLEKEWAPRQ